jgi:hypothetical protein
LPNGALQPTLPTRCIFGIVLAGWRRFGCLLAQFLGNAAEGWALEFAGSAEAEQSVDGDCERMVIGCAGCRIRSGCRELTGVVVSAAPGSTGKRIVESSRAVLTGARLKNKLLVSGQVFPVVLTRARW